MAKNAEDQLLPRPLYRLAGDVHAIKSSGGHAGLWYDKFCDQWRDTKCEENDDPRWDRAKCEKLAWISKVVGNGVGEAELIEEHVNRRRTLVEKCLNGVCLQLYSESRFVTGLGQEHPVENGFAWHPTLGVPYLPGSSIKGLLRAWARDWEDDQERKSQVAAILGTGESRSNEKRKVGAVIIFDALPTQPVRLEADVMTPHYSNYYQDKDTPGDWISPVPIPFLVVSAGTPFQFSFAPRTPAAKEYLPTVEDWLKTALQWLGAGAKTSIGYGRFGEASLEMTAVKKNSNVSSTVLQDQTQSSFKLPNPNDTVEAILLKEKTKKGGWKAKHVSTGISGPVQNTNDLPSEKRAGDTISLIVASANLREIAFRYPTDVEKQRVARSLEKAKSKKKPKRRW